MRRRDLASLVLILGGVSFLFACSGATPTPVPPTAAPTAVPTQAPTRAPTQAPTRAPTQAPTSAPTASAANAASAVQDAFNKFDRADNFRFTARVTAAPAFFQPPYKPGPQDDPNTVLIVSLDGETHGADVHYTLGGFIASFAGALAGFDPNQSTLELVKSGDKVYMRGVLEGQRQAKWYLLPQDQAASMSFNPSDVVKTITAVDFGAGAFTQTGSASVDNQTCAVYAGDRAAFDAVLPKLAQEAALNTDEIDAKTLDTAEFQVTVCPDGNAHRLQYRFAGPVKSKPSDKGAFTYDAQLSGFADTLTIEPPANAEPMPVSANPFGTSEPTAQATATPARSSAFASLDGEWEGTSSTDSPIQFTVENGKLTYANLNYSISSGGCSVGGAYGASIDDGAIQDQKFAVSLTNSDGVVFTFAGTFTDNNAAAGTLNIKGKTYCGDTDDSATWRATHISSPQDSAHVEPTETAVEPTIEIPTLPTSEPTTASSDSGVALVNTAFDALNRGDVDAALAVLDENVVYNIGGAAGIGAANLKSYLQTAAAVGTRYTVSSARALDNIVSFTVTVSGATSGTYPNSSAIVEDGKITILTIQ